MIPDLHARAADTRRFDRGSWLTLGFVLSFTAVCAALSIFLLSVPGDGCQLDPVAEPPVPVLACFGGWPTPLRRGDQLLSVNGLSAIDVDSLGQARTPLPPDWTATGEARYVVQRAGETLTLIVPIRRLGAAGVLRVFGAALFWRFNGPILPIFLGSLVVFLLAPRASAARLLVISSGGLLAVGRFVWSAFTVPVLFTSAPIWALDSLIFLALIWGWLFIPSALLIVLSFPRRIWPLTRWPRGGPLLIYGLSVAVSIVAVITGDTGPYGALLTFGALMVVVGAGATTLYTFLRVRDPVVRAQSAWVALGLIAGFGFWPLNGILPDMTAGQPSWISQLVQFGIGLIFPLSMGIAITRYHLFDIHVIIRRTLVYSTLTLILGVVYFGSVIMLQRIVQALTGSTRSAVVTVISTLLIAALFQPLRRRIQHTIDRRFFRRSYNATQTLEAFSARLRDETDLDRLSDDMVQVVHDTLQPTHVSLWLRSATENRSRDDS